MSIKHFFSNVQQQIQQTSHRSVPEGSAVSSDSPLIGQQRPPALESLTCSESGDAVWTVGERLDAGTDFKFV